jgi:hypothetical protein
MKVRLANGFEAGKNSFEYVLLETIVIFAIVSRGGSPTCLDRLIGKQL